MPPARRRGGKRPGAGAPRGNLNALKHGRHSAQLRALLALLHTPAVQTLIARLVRRQARRHPHLQRDAAAVGLWLSALHPQSPSPLVTLPRLSRRQTRLLAHTLTRYLDHPPIQSIRNGPKTALPDTAPDKKSLTQSKPPGSARLV